MQTVLAFDVEDLVTEESDDAALWCAEILRDEGLRGTFFVVGEKARLWKQRGRQDVIEALKWHDIGFHSTWHSVHPTTSEICLDKTFSEGMDALWKWDSQGWKDAERIFGRPLVAWARTGGSWAPSVHGLMGRKGRSYFYSPHFLGDHNAAWYANCLSFSGFWGGFDAVYCDDVQFEKCLASFEEESARHLSKQEFFCVFMCHPTRVISKEFWDIVNFAGGSNPLRSDWRPQGLQPRELAPTMQKNYRRLIQHIKGRSEFKVVGLSDLAKQYDHQEPFIPDKYLIDFCARIAAEEKILFTDEFTAAELLASMCEAAISPKDYYVRRVAYGPEIMHPNSPVTRFEAKTIRAAAPLILRSLQDSQCLPACVRVGDVEISVGTYFVALAKCLTEKDTVTTPSDIHYPEAATALCEEIRRMLPAWGIHPPDMNLDNLCEQASLQCWSLKPAFVRDAERTRDFAERYGLNIREEGVGR